MRDVVVHPEFDALYYAFYLDGLERRFGARSIRFRALEGAGGGAGRLRFMLPGGARVCLDAYDGCECDERLLEWCDLYAKTNIDAEKMPARQADKLLPIGPGFGVRAWGPLGTLVRSLSTHLAAGRDRRGAPERFAGFYRQLRWRIPESRYRPGACEPGYIFFTGSLWKKEAAINEARAAFIRACRDLPGCRFEGGFAPRELDDVAGYEELTVGRRYSIRQYLRRVKASTVVFNTPGVLSCIGWKLGEFLALGKAILSTPSPRPLPAPLEHGTHVHFIGELAELRPAVQRVLEDCAYRRRLEINARAYYDEHLRPDRVIARICAAARGR